MSEDSPLVSVVLPTYNRADVLERSINSVLSQTYENIELIVVDDGSTDGTEALVREEDDPRLTYLRHDQNRGANAARNTGLARCDGRYIAYLDSDVVWLPTKVEKQAALLADAGESVGGVYSGAYTEFEGYVIEVDQPMLEGDIYEALLSGELFIPTSQLIFRSECFDTAGTWDEALPCFNEYDLCLRVAKQHEFAYLPDPLVINVDYAGASISTDVGRRITGLEKILDKWGPEMEDHHGEGASARFRRLALRTTYRTAALWNARRGEKSLALKRAWEYLRCANSADPLFAASLLVAILNDRLYTAIRREFYRRTGVKRELIDPRAD